MNQKTRCANYKLQGRMNAYDVASTLTVLKYDNICVQKVGVLQVIYK